MRVLRVIPTMDPMYGGPCQGIRNSIPALKELGVYNEVLCLDNPDAIYLDKDPFIIHALGERKGAWAYNKNLIPWLMKNGLHYDVIIIHGLWLFHSYAVNKALTQQKAGKNNTLPKIYVMPHGMLDPYFQKASGRKLKALRNWLYWKLIEGKVVNQADGVFFTSEEELKLARVSFSPYKPKKELNIGYGITEPKPFAQEMKKQLLDSYPSLNNTNYLLFLSRIHEKKGIDLLITAYLKLKKKRQNLPSLLIAGPGLETEFGKKVMILAEGDPNIVFTGMLTGDLKWGAFYGCEAFVLPSHQENFGIAVVEALACRKPVLVTNQVNIWREIKQAGGGIVKDDTLEGIEELLDMWFTLEEKNKLIMREKAFLTYTKYFTVEQAAKRMNEVLSDSR